MRRRSLTLFALALVALWPMAASGQGAGAKPAVPDTEFVPGQYFVGFRAGAGETGIAAVRGLGVSVTARYPRIRAAAVRLPGGDAAAQALARTPGVAYVERMPRRYALGLPEEQLVPALDNGLYGLVTTRATDAHANGFSGAGIKVGVADQGLDYYHPDIAPVYRGGIDTIWGDNDPIFEAVFDEDWDEWVVETHGTHVAGTVAAANNSVGVVGVAPSVELYHARVLDPWGGTVVSVMDGVQWLVETAGCKIINLSLGGQAPSIAEEAFYQDMRNRGALIVCAAGNAYGGPVIYPAAYPSNIAVGAVDVNNAVADFSSVGTGLDVAAPGVGVLSSVSQGWGMPDGRVQTPTGTLAAIPFLGTGTTSGITGTLVYCGLGGVGDFPPSVNGNIALIQRGTLLFEDKVANAQNNGALAVIIYNNVPGDFQGAAYGDGFNVPVPTVGVSDTAGATLMGQVGSQATVVNWVQDYDVYSGTSMAAPHVTGALALMWSANPSASNDAVEGSLFATCRDLGAAGYDTTFGFGLIDVLAAIAKAQSPGSPPLAPTGLTATPGNEQIALAWNAAAGADYYVVQRAPVSGGPFQVISQATGTSYIDPGLTSAVPYYYVVASVNPSGTSANSNEATATPIVQPPPAPPTNLTAKAAKRSVTLKWAQSATSGVTQNRVYRSTTNGGPYTLRITLGPATSFTDTGLISGLTYYYRVTAVKAGKESTPSNQASARAR